MTITTAQRDAGRAPRATGRLRVALIVGGFPDAEHPISNVFGVRTAQALAGETDLSTIVLRAWLPRRRLRSTEVVHDLRVTTTSVPQWPHATLTNLLVYRYAGWPLVRSILRDVDVVHSGDMSSIGVIAGHWARRAGKAHVTQATQFMSPTTVGHLWSHALAGWRADIDAVACNSDALKGKLRSLWPELPNVQTVYRGVDLRLFNPEGAWFNGLPEAAGARFLYAGGFPSYPRLPHSANTKGGFTLLGAWAACEERLHASGAVLVVAGPGCEGAEVRAWHARLRYATNVEILGAVRADLMPSLVRWSDVVLVPSLHEGLPNIAMEAAATARAVVGSDIPPLREVVLDGHTGVLLPAGDEVAWGAALVSAATERSARQRYGKAARARMQAQFDQRNYAASMIELYEAAIARRSSATAPARDSRDR